MRLRDLFSDDATIDPQAEAAVVTGLAVDSRAVKPGDLFFALAGSKTDGARFIDSVTNGVRNMPPWGDVIKPDGVAALWAYLVAGEK